MRSSALLVSIAFICVLPSARAAAQDPAKFFDDNCAMCHVIGGQPEGAPDLKGVTTRRDHSWLVRLIVDPEHVAQTDPQATALVKQWDNNVMPKIDGVTPELAEALLRYIDARSGAPAPAAAAAPAPPPLPTGDPVAGRDLYAGRRRLVNGGPACMSCHQLADTGGFGGGTLGPDLTKATQRLGGVRGLSAWLGNPPTKVMKTVFRQTPLNPTETAAIVALIDRSSAAAPVAAAPSRRFFAAGVAGFVALLALVGLAGARRFRAVRQPLVARARTRAGEDR